MRVGPTPDDRRRAEDLEAIYRGDEAIARLRRLKRKRSWAVWGQAGACPFCRAHKPHTGWVHNLLLPATQRELPRAAYNSAVKRAERAWTQRTGEKIKMEALLFRELGERRPPTSYRVLAEKCGVTLQTIGRWALHLGLEPQPITWWCTHE